MMQTASLVLIALAGVYLVALGLSGLLAPVKAGRFLLGFAQSPSRHYLELALRFLVGVALVGAAPRLPWSRGYALFGGVLLLTTLLLACLPWHVHGRLAQASVSRAARYLPAISIASLLAGVAILASVHAASAT